MFPNIHPKPNPNITKEFFRKQGVPCSARPSEACLQLPLGEPETKEEGGADALLHAVRPRVHQRLEPADPHEEAQQREAVPVRPVCQGLHAQGNKHHHDGLLIFYFWEPDPALSVFF